MSSVWLPQYMSGGSIPEDLLGWLCWSIISFFQRTCSIIFIPFLSCELTKLPSNKVRWGRGSPAASKCGPTGVHGKPSVAQFGSPGNQQTMNVPAGTKKFKRFHSKQDAFQTCYIQKAWSLKSCKILNLESTIAQVLMSHSVLRPRVANPHAEGLVIWVTRVKAANDCFMSSAQGE